MRILYTHTASLIGGANRMMLSLLGALDRSRFQPLSVLPEPGPMEEELRARDVPYVILDLRPTKRSRLATAQLAAGLAARFVSHRADVLHANDPFTYRLASAVSRLTHVRRICHVHHPDQTAGSMEWAFKTPPHLVLVPSRYVKSKVEEWLEGAGLSERSVLAVGNPIDVDRFRPAADVRATRQALNLDPDALHVSILAALAPHKGHVCFLRMAAIVHRLLPRTQFHVVGSSRSGSRSHAESLTALVSELGLEGAVRLWGFVPDQTAEDLLRASDLFVLPTQEEGFGLSVAEAQACGVPVLTSAIRPLDEVVLDGRSGWLLPPDDHESFAQRAIELLQSEERRREFSVAGRAFIRAHYPADRFAASIMELYERLSSRTNEEGRDQR